MNRIVVASILALSLAVAGPSSPLERLWAFFASLGDVSADKEGCGADPNGRCVPEPNPQDKAGCGADPNGKPLCS